MLIIRMDDELLVVASLLDSIYFNQSMIRH